MGTLVPLRQVHGWVSSAAQCAVCVPREAQAAEGPRLAPRQRFPYPATPAANREQTTPVRQVPDAAAVSQHATQWAGPGSVSPGNPGAHTDLV